MTKAQMLKAKLTKSIRRTAHCKCPKTKSGFRCIEWGPSYCSGEMMIRKHDRSCQIWSGKECDCSIKCRTWVGAHNLPVFVQCSGCGYAPGKTEQVLLMGRMLTKT